MKNVKREIKAEYKKMYVISSIISNVIVATITILIKYFCKLDTSTSFVVWLIFARVINRILFRIFS
jgi:hypothetical protein